MLSGVESPFCLELLKAVALGKLRYMVSSLTLASEVEMSRKGSLYVPRLGTLVDIVLELTSRNLM